MNLGFIGAGNMGGAIIKGLIASKAAEANDIYITRRNKELMAAQAAELGVNPCQSAGEITKASDVLFLAVKPNMYSEILPAIKAEVKARMPLVISMAAGISTDDIEKTLDIKGVRVVRIMPNVNAQVMMSVTAYCGGKNATADDIELAKSLLSAFGSAVEIDEKLFAVFSAIAGCSPAYVYMFINSLAEGALKAGMNKKLALEIAAGAVMGSAKTVLSSGIHPEQLNDTVCSPGGTTIEGVCTLKALGFENAVIEAVTKSIEKDAMLKK